MSKMKVLAGSRSLQRFWEEHPSMPLPGSGVPWLVTTYCSFCSISHGHPSVFPLRTVVIRFKSHSNPG